MLDEFIFELLPVVVRHVLRVEDGPHHNIAVPARPHCELLPVARLRDVVERLETFNQLKDVGG